uniref:Putative plant transposon protein domain-containing protein n=1 Tax=Nicotiana tabacum TaxID=4097 RepID=A0A1S3Z304_TOBAC|nr:PREDICTED: uncharacterized protein LOC107782444 [Nicotiana tabacum]
MKIIRYFEHKMASGNDEIVQELTPPAVEEEYFDRARFTGVECERNYDKLMSKSIIKERGIHLGKLDAKMQYFFRRLTDSGWICFAPEPIKDNYIVVREFYAKALKIDFHGKVFTFIKGKRVNFDPKVINAYFILPNADNEVCRTRARERGSQWLVEKLHDRVTPTWERFHKGVDFSEFTAEAKTWLSIICARILPSKHESEVMHEKALMITAIMDDLPVNMGHHMVSEIEKACNGRCKSLYFPLLITQFYYDTRVLKDPNDSEKDLGTAIYPLLRKGPTGGKKKRRIDVSSSSFGQFIDTAARPGGSSTAAVGLHDPISPLPYGLCATSPVKSMALMYTFANL